VKRFSLSLSVCSAVLAGLTVAGTNPSAASDEVSFAGKTITMTIGNAAGSGIDLYGRLLGRHLVQHLPGHPNVIVINQPGAGGLIAYNSWVTKAARDGLHVAIGGLTELDPANLLGANAQYNPATFKYVGGLAAPSQGLFIRKEVLPRLYDKTAAPVVMGAVGSAIRGGYYQVLWGAAFLGWNVKWVPAYRDTSELRQAMERGEVDMSTFGNVRDIDNLLKSGKFSVVSQSGSIKDGKIERRPELGDAPIFADLARGQIKDPLAQRAFDYGENVAQAGRWLALPPDTPDSIVAIYLKAYDAMVKYPEYSAQIDKTDPGSPQVNKADLDNMVSALSTVSQDVIDFVKAEQRRQGFIVE
jgi:tripartite-type tricarboxylate transporter receptor subunit TctC